MLRIQYGNAQSFIRMTVSPMEPPKNLQRMRRRREMRRQTRRIASPRASCLSNDTEEINARKLRKTGGNGRQLVFSLDSEKSMLQILCLHGYRQTAAIFRSKVGAFRRMLKKHAEFYFANAPNEIPYDGEIEGLNAWWFSNYKQGFESKRRSEVCLGFENSLNALDRIWRESGPFDGLLGFSQGATFVSVLCGMQKKELLDYHFYFAIMIGGFKSRCLPHDNYYEEKVDIPTLHVFGKRDEIIPKEMSEELATYFEEPVIHEHPGGHYVPATFLQKTVYTHFLIKMQRDAVEHGRDDTPQET